MVGLADPLPASLLIQPDASTQNQRLNKDALHSLWVGPLHLSLEFSPGGGLKSVLLPALPPESLQPEHLQLVLSSLKDLPLTPAASSAESDFRLQMEAIPCGSTRTYGTLATALHTAPRGVASRCAANPLLLRIPCHRVVAKNGLGGFRLGNEWKSCLLRLEADIARMHAI